MMHGQFRLGETNLLRELVSESVKGETGQLKWISRTQKCFNVKWSTPIVL